MLIKDPPQQLTERLWMLGSSGYPLYLVRGDGEAALFEGGIGAMGPLLLEQMDELGITKESVKQVIVTHGHPDHVMAVPLFREIFPQLTVAASKIAAATLSAEKAIGFFCQLDAALTASVEKAGWIDQRHRPKPLAEKQIAVDRIIGEGDTIAVDGVSFDVLETPGHSDCSLSFHDPANAVLLISDATGYYMPEHDCWWPNYFSDYEAYLGSMRRLAELDAEILCLSHNAVIRGVDDVRAYFAAAVSATEQYHQRIVSEAQSGKTVREIAEQLGCEAYEQKPLLPLDFFQKHCGLLVKQSARHAGISVSK